MTSPAHEDRYACISRLADQIEQELRSLQWWREEPPTQEQMDFSAAFAMDTMPLQMWIQFVLLPRVREIISERGSFPGQSMVGAHAVREFDGETRAHKLVSLLSEFDQAVEA